MRPDVEDMLNELLWLEENVRRESRRIEEIKIWCKGVGAFSTPRYVCAITERHRTSLVSLEEATKILGIKVLTDNNLVRITTYKIVSVSKREDSVQK